MTTQGATTVLSNMLVATDLSARSDRAVERAVLLANQTQAVLTIMHVIDDADLRGTAADQMQDDARALIASHVAGLSNQARTRIEIVFGKAGRDILEVAERVKAELIVLGIHRNESRERFRGTTAERVIRTGVRPVLLVKAKPQRPYARLIVGVDFSACCRRAVEFAVRLIPGGEFHLVHAFDVPYKAFLTGDDSRREISKDQQQQMHEFVGTDLTALQTALQAVPPRVFQVVKQGTVRQVIHEQVDRLKPDLLVVGTHGRSGFAHAMLGSVAEDLLSHPPCDVLAVRQ